MLNISWRYFLFDCSPVIQRFLKAKNLEIQPFIKNNQQKSFIIAPLEFKFWCRRWWFLCFLKWAFGPILTWRITDQIFTIQTKQQIVKLSNYNIYTYLLYFFPSSFLLLKRAQTENDKFISTTNTSKNTNKSRNTNTSILLSAGLQNSNWKWVNDVCRVADWRAFCFDSFNISSKRKNIPNFMQYHTIPINTVL